MKYTTKPQNVDAVQWNGDNIPELQELIGTDCHIQTFLNSRKLYLDALNGLVIVNLHEFVVKDKFGFVKAYTPMAFDGLFIKVEQSETHTVQRSSTNTYL